MSAYEQLAELAERELWAVRAGAFDDLPALDHERRRLIAQLPAQPPATARPALERARDTQEELISALLAVRERTGRELARIRTGRQAVRAYGQISPALRAEAGQTA
jgi:hypothetical protein